MRGVFFNKGRSKLIIVGVIDTLTEYTNWKKMEYYIKKCKHGKKQSCIPPTMYGERFYNFMEDVVFSNEQGRMTIPHEDDSSIQSNEDESPLKQENQV